MSTSRSVRRAEERRARKIARKQGLPEVTIDVAEVTPMPSPCIETAAQTEAEPLVTPAPLSPARLEANRSNAQLSSGPVTPAGKAKASQNALRTALTGRTVLLPGDDTDRYARRLAEYNKLYRPVGVRELELVQALADAWWRLDRIPGLIEALYAKGSTELAERVAYLDPAARAGMLRMETYLAYERQFRNLELQEGRLHRYAQNLKQELAELQKQRDEREAEDYATAAMLYIAAKKDRKPFDPAYHGFEFSTADVEAYLAGQRARALTEKAVQNGELPAHTLGRAA